MRKKMTVVMVLMMTMVLAIVLVKKTVYEILRMLPLSALLLRLLLLRLLLLLKLMMLTMVMASVSGVFPSTRSHDLIRGFIT